MSSPRPQPSPSPTPPSSTSPSPQTVPTNIHYRPSSFDSPLYPPPTTNTHTSAHASHSLFPSTPLHKSPAAASLLQLSLGVFFGNLTTLAILSILYLNYLLFEPYLQIFAWSFVLSAVLRKYKTLFKTIIAHLQRTKTPLLSLLLSHLHSHVSLHLSSPTGPLFFVIDNSYVCFFCLAFLRVVHSFLPSALPLLLTVAVGSLLLLHLFGRSLLFSFRRLGVSDDLFATIMTLSMFLFSSLFVLAFLSTRGIMDGFRGALSCADYLHTEAADHAANSVELSRKLDDALEKLNDFAVAQYNSTAETYGNASWFETAVDPIVGDWFEGDRFLLLDSSADPDPTTSPDPVAAARAFFDTLTLAGVKEQIQTLNITTEQLSQYAQVTATAAGGGAAVLVDGLGVLSTIFSSISDFVIKLVMFVTFLVLLLESNTDQLTDIFLDLLPTASIKTKHEVSTVVKDALMGVLLLPIRLAAARSCIMVVWLLAFGGRHVFFAALLCFLHAVFPIAPSYLICLPWVVGFVVSKRYLPAAVVFLGIKICLSIADDRLYERHLRSVNPLFTSLSILLGFRAFGAKGVLIGPLCLTMMVLCYVGLKAAEAKNMEVGRASPPLQRPAAAPGRRQVKRSSSFFLDVIRDSLGFVKPETLPEGDEKEGGEDGEKMKEKKA